MPRHEETVSLTAAYVREKQSERSVRASQIIPPVLMHFLTDKLSLHTPPPQLTFVPQPLWKHEENVIDSKVQAEE